MAYWTDGMWTDGRWTEKMADLLAAVKAGGKAVMGLAVSMAGCSVNRGLARWQT